MPDTIELTINDTQVNGALGATILEVARAKGIDIPTLCYHEKLAPIGACRLCMVEIAGARTLVAACYTPVSQGMVVYTHSPKVVEARRAIVELMLASHPESCLVCDKANICELRQLAADLGVGLPRFRLRKKFYPIEDVSPYVIRDMSKCILCRRCVRGCSEIAGQNIFAIANRGFESKVVVDLDDPLDKEVCRDCEVCTALCPTGALALVSQKREGKQGQPLVIKG
jgi:NADH-quinone oxidoreductase subunit G/NADP-reducing hydrogenase subunit HndD